MGAGDELDREIDEHYREKLREPGPGPDPGAAGAPAELRTRDGRTQEELDREMDEYFKKEPLEPWEGGGRGTEKGPALEPLEPGPELELLEQDLEPEPREAGAGAGAGEDQGPVVIPEYACQYCGVDDPKCLVRCSGSGKWFCNGRSGGTAASHIVNHLVRSRNREVALHPENALGDTVLECYNCGLRNVFLLGFVPSTGGVVVLLCRDPCLQNNALRDMEWDLDQWQPLVEERALLKWLVAEPAPDAARRRISDAEARRLEELWAENPQATLEDLQALGAQEEETPPLPMRYKDVAEYREVFGGLVEMEAEHERSLMENYEMTDLTLVWGDDGSGSALGGLGRPVAVFASRLHAERGSDMEYPGELAQMSLPARGWSGTGRVVRCSYGGEVAVEFKSDQGVPTDVTEGFSAKFAWKSVSFDRMRGALKGFRAKKSMSKFLKDAFLGLTKPEEVAAAGTSSMQWISGQWSSGQWNVSAPNLPELNPYQAAAVRQVLGTPLSLIQGPPGTGKTVTSATIVYHMTRLKGIGQVLVCAPSNVAVDQLTDKIEQTGLKVVRVCARSRESLASSVKHLTLHEMLASLAEDSPLLQRESFAKPYVALRRKKAAIPRLSPKEEKQFYIWDDILTAKLLQSADVICCTCVGAGDFRLAKMKFRAVLLDECTQATEPTTLVPLVKGAHRVVMVGDQCQLGPVVPCKKAARAGLSEGMFQRLVAMGNLPIRLQVQYRMHPCLSEFPSNMFYEGSLQNGVSATERRSRVPFPWPHPERPMMFYVQMGKEEVAASGTSYLNRTEATSVEKIVTMFLRAGVLPSKIGVITPYEGQRTWVQGQMLRGPLRQQLYQEVEVASVDAFQGREKDYIVLSCVRSNENLGIGFLSDPRRLNVALTRAKYGCVVLGNPKLLSRNGLWHELIAHFKEANCMVEGSLKNLKPSFAPLSRPKKPYEYRNLGYKYAEQVAEEEALIRQAAAYQATAVLAMQECRNAGMQEEEAREALQTLRLTEPPEEGRGKGSDGASAGGQPPAAPPGGAPGGAAVPTVPTARHPAANPQQAWWGAPTTGYAPHYPGYAPPGYEPRQSAFAPYHPGYAPQYPGMGLAGPYMGAPGGAPTMYSSPAANGSAGGAPAPWALGVGGPPAGARDPAEISKRNNEAEFFSMILDFVQDEHGEEQS